LLGLNFRPVSYDTIWWFLVRVRPNALQRFMLDWLKALPVNLKNQVLAIDGKRLRGASNNEHITHLVELFATESRLMIAQEKVPDKKGERKALPSLLKNFDVSGAIISMDAHYTYKPELKQIQDAGADYIVGIKGNQGTLHAEVVNYFTQAHAIDYDSEEFECHTTLDKGHGRLETRKVCVSCDLEWLNGREKWGFEALIEVRSQREIKGKKAKEVRYYGSSRKATAKEFARWIRDHWQVENGLHYVLDVVFREDAARASTGYAAENLGLFRRMAMNVIKTFDPNRGFTDAIRNAAFEPAYLRGLLARLFAESC